MKKITLLTCFMFFSLFSVVTIHAESSSVQRVRIDFTSPDGYVRHLLLGFTNDIATDGFDFGYDAVNIDNFPNDLNWLIEDERYVIQGVGAYETSKIYPLGLFLRDGGQIQIALNALENFTEDIPVYVFDLYDNTYTLLNEATFNTEIASGDYLDRFYITFSANSIPNINGANSALLTINDANADNSKINYYTSSNILHVTSNSAIQAIQLIDLQGRIISNYTTRNSKEVKIPIQINSSGTVIVVVSTDRLQSSKMIVL